MQRDRGPERPLAASDVLRTLLLRQTAPPRQRPRQEPERLPGVTCRGCGARLPRSRMRNCPECWAELPGQDPDAWACRCYLGRWRALLAEPPRVEMYRTEAMPDLSVTSPMSRRPA